MNRGKVRGVTKAQISGRKSRWREHESQGWLEGTNRRGPRGVSVSFMKTMTQSRGDIFIC